MNACKRVCVSISGVYTHTHTHIYACIYIYIYIYINEYKWSPCLFPLSSLGIYMYKMRVNTKCFRRYLSVTSQVIA
jgi:hypothetical protein